MRHSEKRILLAVILLIALFMLCACGVSSSGSFTSSGLSHSMSDGRISAEYRNFNGNRTYSITLKQGDVLKISVKGESGTLGFSVSGPDGEAQKEDAASGDYEIPVEKEGSWSVTVTAQDHQGSYLITWK